MKTHTLKTWPHFFASLLDGSKNFEIRKNDRGFEKGDTLILVEWVPCQHTSSYGNATTVCPDCQGQGGALTGRTIQKRVTYICKGFIGISDGFCIMALEDVK